MFVLSWLVMHVIDDDSPLSDIDWSESESPNVGVVATLIGHDGTYGQTVYSRQSYAESDVVVGSRFVDIISEREDGRLQVDYARFHDTISDGQAPTDGVEYARDLGTARD